MPMSGGAYVSPVWVNGGAPYLNADELQALTDTAEGNQTASGKVIDLPAAGWAAHGDSGMLFSQTVTISGYTVTEHTRADLRADAQTVAVMQSSGVFSLVIENDAGTLTAFAVWHSPRSDLHVEAELRETI